MKYHIVSVNKLVLKVVIIFLTLGIWLCFFFNRKSFVFFFFFFFSSEEKVKGIRLLLGLQGIGIVKKRFREMLKFDKNLFI